MHPLYLFHPKRLSQKPSQSNEWCFAIGLRFLGLHVCRCFDPNLDFGVAAKLGASVATAILARTWALFFKGDWLPIQDNCHLCKYSRVCLRLSCCCWALRCWASFSCSKGINPLCTEEASLVFLRVMLLSLQSKGSWYSPKDANPLCFFLAGYVDSESCDDAEKPCVTEVPERCLEYQ